MNDKKIDIFDILKRIDNKDIAFLHSLTTEEKKSLAPVVISRWLSGCNDPKQIIRVNTILNPFIFSLYKEKDLLLKLLFCASTGKKMYKWHSKKATDSKSLKIEILCSYYKCTQNEAKSMLNFHTIDDLTEMARLCHYQESDIKKIK